uniref:UBC core domain-containing protein n=1 Tax=viral metagenome TaxID=1070528 RepID=A0A6C0DV44_9ZZZZ
MNNRIITRINHELYSLYKKYNNIQVHFDPETNIHKITVIDKKYNIIFLINDTIYPFRPPSFIYINNILYKDFINIPTHLLPYALKEGHCFCCDTITNKKIWQPCHTLIHIMNEFDYIKQTMNEAFVSYLLYKIKHKYSLPEYFDLIEEYLQLK